MVYLWGAYNDGSQLDHALSVLVNANKLSAVNWRIALRVCSASTASDNALFIISGMMAIDILVDKMTHLHIQL